MHFTGRQRLTEEPRQQGFPRGGTDDQPPALTSELPTDSQQRPGLRRATANVSAARASETAFQERAAPTTAAPLLVLLREAAVLTLQAKAPLVPSHAGAFPPPFGLLPPSHFPNWSILSGLPVSAPTSISSVFIFLRF